MIVININSTTNAALANIYIGNKILNETTINNVLEEIKDTNKRLDLELLSRQMVFENNNAIVYAEYFGLDYYPLDNIKYDSNTVQMVTGVFLAKYSIAPLYKKDGIVYAAIANPFDLLSIKKIIGITKGKYRLVITTKADIDKLQGLVFAKATSEIAIKQHITNENIERNKHIALSDLENADIKNAPAVKLVESLINESIALNASDIHIEPYEKFVRVRYRIDGVLHQTSSFDISMYASVSTRLKIIAGLNIAEKRLPQDGRIKLLINNINYDFRVSTLPTVYGEKIVVRILDTTAFNFTRQEIGFLKETNVHIDKMLSSPHGIILLTGPTGCGKSTTLYTFIKELNNNNLNIITVEDPVEYSIDGVNQVQVNVKANLTFAAALRSILRQDPNIIMIGEMRDEETAEIGIRSAITGHLVLSTLHTNDAVGAISRLIDMGVQPYFVADAIVGVIAQRLIRLLCPQCKKEEMTNRSEMEILNLNNPQKIYKPHGCIVCKYTGYKGRTGVHEVLIMSNVIKEMVQKNASIEEIRKQALNDGMWDLRETTRRKVLNGETSIAELLAVAYTN